MNIENLIKKTEVLARTIAMLAPLYHDKNLDESQKGLLETLIGAGIWYLPNSRVLFSGKISKAALAKIKVDPEAKLVQEHGYPRKVAGNKLFNEHLTGIIKDKDTFYNLFLEKFGKYNLVLKEENLQLKKYQKTGVFVSEAEAYHAAEIELVNLTDDDFNLPQLKSYRTKSIEIDEPEINRVVIEELTEGWTENPLEGLKNQNADEDTEFDEREEEVVFHLNANDTNPTQQYKRFLHFIIDNFSLELENTDLLKKFFTRDPNDEVLGAARNYQRVKCYKGWYYSNHVGTPGQMVRINKIVSELQIQLVA